MFTPFRTTAAPSRRVQICAEQKQVSRRHVYGLSAVLAPLLFTDSARALLSFDDDEEMVEKAKANRAQRLKEDKEANRRYVDSSGYRDRSVEQKLIPVQTAVYKLAKAGEELQNNDAKSAAKTLSADWVQSFESAGKSIASTPDTISRVGDIVTVIKESAAAANSGKLAEAKSAYVTAVESVEVWVVDAGVAGQLKGL